MHPPSANHAVRNQIHPTAAANREARSQDSVSTTQAAHLQKAESGPRSLLGAASCYLHSSTLVPYKNWLLGLCAGKLHCGLPVCNLLAHKVGEFGLRGTSHFKSRTGEYFPHFRLI